MRRSSLLSLPLILVLTACAGQERPPDSTQPVGADVDAWTGELPIVAPWLREQLPAGTLTYQRIPNLLATLAIPKGNMLDTALGSDANIRNLIGIRQGLSENVLDGVPPFADAVYQLIVQHLVSPIEVAAIGLPQISGVIAMTLDFRSRAEVDALFAELSQNPQLPNLTAPLDARGFGQLAVPIPVFVHFDEASGRFALYGGPMATLAAFAALLDPSNAPEAQPMAALERQIDESGQGYFGWVDTTQGLALGSMFIPPETMQMLRMTGLDQLQSIAFGAGVADGKGRLKFVADVGSNSATRMIPIIDNRIDARSVGDPRSLFVLSIPSAAEFARLEGVVFALFPPEIREQWNGLKADFADAAGASIEEILSAVGPDLITIKDRAGNYSGIRVRDSELLDDVLDRLAAKAGITIDERRVDGQRIRYVSVKGPTPKPPPGQDIPPPAAAMLDLMARMRTHIYWVEEGDYLYVAGMPQILMDRARLRPDTSVSSWLATTQRVDLSHAMLGATGTVANLPRTMYQAYLAVMQSLADLTEARYDVWSMPSAVDLGLPERGTLGFSFNLGEPYLSLELTYESHPVEVLLAGGGGVAAVAAAGVMAAIAIPAYRDYTIRAQVSEGLTLANPAKAAVAAAYASNGSVPADRAASGLPPDPSAASGQYVRGIAIEDGRVVIQYGNAANPQIAGRSLDLRPYVAADGSIVWVCGYASASPALESADGDEPGATTIPSQYLPSGCR